jgi:REP element-mobilizing transposase RayT
MTQYFGFGGKLHHEIPHWVEPEALFHIRIRCAADTPAPLTEPALAAALLDSVRFYEAREIWHTVIFLLMPDHLHAMLAFGRERAMSHVIGDWKRFCTLKHGVKWQENYFDHRLRNREQVEAKFHYILNNPAAKGLCDQPESWPWKIECLVDRDLRARWQ